MIGRSLLFAACLISTTALADDPAWKQAQDVAQATGVDVNKFRSLLAIAPHVETLEKALADGVAAQPGMTADGKTIVLTDGLTETIAAMAAAAKSGKGAAAQPNPYPDIALYLGLYYNEVHKYDDALRVIAAGLRLAYTDSMGTHLPKLYSERANAYAQSRRYEQALATDDTGLTLTADKDTDRARFQRGRGFALVELGRLDDAKMAYQESLKFEPGNALATRELAYVERLKAGGAKAATEQVTTHSPAADAAKPNP